MAQDSQTIKSLFDYLYIDRDRLSSYSAQLFEYGSLTSIKSTEGVNKKFGSHLEGGIPKILNSRLSEDASTNESLERSFDAAWSLPLNVINALDQHGLVNRDISSTNYGQLVLIKGAIQLLDLSMLQNMWDGIAKMMVNELPTATSAQKKAKQEAEKEAKDMASVISKLPHTLQFKVFNDEAMVWSTLKPEHMIINPFDFAMKHGATISGEWFALGIVDAKPSDIEDFDKIATSNELEKGLLFMLSQLRSVMGRSLGDYGITPVAVFREIK
ncbi:Uncharacterised protein [Chromobacterium violaceum]|uniref:Uncharacterized protein n=1 Tax=Chromobacterium violaceum TaxID=536 RepID=A0A3S4J1B2_CHRVL|nr:Uncharacterised protein [Chromobacterium violaceum]